MRKIKEVLRLRYACGLSLEQIARAQNLSKGVVAKYLKRAAAAGIDGTTAQTLDEADFAQRLKPSNDPCGNRVSPRPTSLRYIKPSSTKALPCNCSGKTTVISVLVALTATPASASNIESLPKP